MPDTDKYRIEIHPMPQFIPEQSDPDNDRYIFAYTISIKNIGKVPAQLVSRHWVITDGNNDVQEVRGLGVVGKQPLLQPGESFQYTSGSSLTLLDMPRQPNQGLALLRGAPGYTLSAAMGPISESSLS